MPLSQPRSASCSCGDLRADVFGDPMRVSVCHCLACQRRTGSVFGAQARFPNEAVNVRGESRQYIRVGDSGRRITFSFCPKCGSTVFYTIEDQPDRVAIPVGAFADPQFQNPTFSVYESRMHSWVHIAADVEHMA
jgi:hypothetical protein